jgi:nucleoside-diphosphate-sugar epimerase
MPRVTPSDGPVAVTGASGYIGSHTVLALLKRGYTVHGCVTDASNPEKTEHLLAMNASGHSGRVELCEGNLFEPGSYDEAFHDCCAVVHVATVMSYGGKNRPRDVYEGAVAGTTNVLESVNRSSDVRRLVYASSFAAIAHPAPSGYLFTEGDWAGDNREGDASWNRESINDNGEVAYAMSKVETEHLVNRVAEEHGRFDAISVCPSIVLGPLLCKSHELVYSWQWFIARMLEGEPCKRNWEALWNIVDVRDVAEAQALILESPVCTNGSRYQLTATDATGELDVYQLKEHLEQLFPDIVVGGAPPEMRTFLERRGHIQDSPRARCDLARDELGLKTHSIEDTLEQTGRTMIDLGLCEPAWTSSR